LTVVVTYRFGAWSVFVRVPGIEHSLLGCKGPVSVQAARRPDWPYLIPKRSCRGSEGFVGVSGEPVQLTVWAYCAQQPWIELAIALSGQVGWHPNWSDWQPSGGHSACL
jgi:hypothetical protein